MKLLDNLTDQIRDSAAARWLASKDRNEQTVIGLLGGLTVVTVLWLGVWKPVSDWREVEDNRYRNALKTLDWMRLNEARARATAGRRTAQGGERSLMPIITRSAETGGLQLTRLQPEGDGGVSVVLQGQPFNDVVRWLHQLERNNEIAVARVSFDSEGTAGLVNAQIRFQ